LFRFGVRAVPTFAFIKAGQTLATIKGGNKEQLEAKVKELANQAGAKLIEGVPEGMVDITASIDKVSLSK
jgi:thioredoxin-like negative regulator of GroEL